MCITQTVTTLGERSHLPSSNKPTLREYPAQGMGLPPGTPTRGILCDPPVLGHPIGASSWALLSAAAKSLQLQEKIPRKSNRD